MQLNSDLLYLRTKGDNSYLSFNGVAVKPTVYNVFKHIPLPN